MFRVRDNLNLDDFVRRSRFLLFVVFLEQLAHFFGAGCFFIGGGGFRIWRVSIPIGFDRFASG